MTTSNTTIDNDEVTTAIARATAVSENLKHSIRALIMREQTEALNSVLTRLNGDQDGQGWEMVKREPATLLTLLISEYSRRLQDELVVLGEKEKTS